MIQTCQVSCIMHRTYSISPYHSAYNSHACEGGAMAFLPLRIYVAGTAAWPLPATRACLRLGNGQRGHGAPLPPEHTASRQRGPGEDHRGWLFRGPGG